MNLFLLPLCFSFMHLQSTDSLQFEVTFQQNGKDIPVQNKIVKLEPKSFTIKVKYTGKYVLLYANSLPVYYDLKDDEHIPGLDSVNRKVISEYNHNSKNQIVVDGNGVCCWSYHPKYDVSGFNNVEVKNDTITGYREVENLFFPKTDKTVSVLTYKKPVYLVFFEYTCKQDSCSETQRDPVKIEWKTGK